MKAAEEGKIGVKAWNQISLLPEAEQEGLLAMFLAGMSTSQAADAARKSRGATTKSATVKVSRVKCPVPGTGATVVTGEALSLSDMIEAVAEILKLAKRENEKGIDVSTFQRVCQDLAKKG